mgnify:CR=1 FL=1
MLKDLLMTQPMAEPCVKKLEETFIVHRLFDTNDKEGLISEFGSRVRAIAGGRVSASLIQKLPKLEIIAVQGVGYESVDTAMAKSRNIRVTNTPNVLNDAVAEMTIGLMIALARHIPQADKFVRAGHWANGNFSLRSELNGKTLGIFGLGRIGREIANRAQAMKMRVVYCGRNAKQNEALEYYKSIVDMAHAVDWLVLIAPGGQETNNIVSREVMAALGPDGMLVNMSRGSLVDQDAMVEMLKSGELGGAALDVYNNEPNVSEAVIALENVVLSPHQGSKTKQTRISMGDLVVANLRAHFSGESLISPVV